MPRTHGAGRGTRLGFRGNITGTTFVTWPSGTTITKDVIQTPGGYALNYASNKSVVFGTCEMAAGTETFTATTLGLTTIDYMLVNTASTNQAGATIGQIYTVQCGLSGSSATVFSYSHTGVTMGEGVSIAYVAIGTL